LRKNGIDIAIHDMTGKLPLAAKMDAMHVADIYGICLFSTTITSTKAIIRHIRKTVPEALIYLGGPHPSALPEETVAEFNVDGVVVNEGEYAFYSIVLTANAGAPVYGVIQGKPIHNLDVLPFPSRNLVERSRYTRRMNGTPCISMLTSRGCHMIAYIATV